MYEIQDKLKILKSAIENESEIDEISRFPSPNKFEILKRQTEKMRMFRKLEKIGKH